MKRRLCAQCGAELIPDGMLVPGAAPCGDCGAMRLPESQGAVMASPLSGPEDTEETVEVFVSETGRGQYRQFQQGPFIFRQYTTTRQGGGWGCGCGCLFIAFIFFLIVRGFLSLFG